MKTINIHAKITVDDAPNETAPEDWQAQQLAAMPAGLQAKIVAAIASYPEYGPSVGFITSIETVAEVVDATPTEP